MPYVSKEVEVEVEVELDDFSDDELLEELEARGIGVPVSESSGTGSIPGFFMIAPSAGTPVTPVRWQDVRSAVSQNDNQAMKNILSDLLYLSGQAY